MFSGIKEFFAGDSGLHIDATGQATDKDVQMAVGVLLLEMAGRDEDYAPEEVQTIFRIMGEAFQLEKQRILEILEIADKARGEKEKIDEFVTAVNANFDEKQRIRILTMVWKVVIADGNIDKFETRFAAQMKSRLQLSDTQAEEARQAAFKISQ